MAIRKSKDETLVVHGERKEWFDKCRAALERQGFGHIEIDDQLGQVHASYKKLTVWGSIDITLRPVDADATEIHLAVTANVDNLYALFRSPTKKILETFKSGLNYQQGLESTA
jgi:hypothetical protein